MEEAAHHLVRLLFSSLFLFYSFVPGKGLIHETRMHINTGCTIRKGALVVPFVLGSINYCNMLFARKQLCEDTAFNEYKGQPQG